MKKLSSLCLLATLLISFFAPSSQAQQLRFGYLDYTATIKGMVEYSQLQERVAALREQYNKEAEYNEDKFFKMYAEYIQGQKTFPEEIMLKRQKELQVAMEQGVSFRQDAERLLVKAEAEMRLPLEQKLDSAIAKVAREYELSFVVNTEGKAYSYINPSQGEDITQLVGLVLAGQPLPKREIETIEQPQKPAIEAVQGLQK